MKGQALVEFALVAPIMFALLLGMIEVARLGYERDRYAESAGVLADAVWTIGYPSPEWEAMADAELARVGCDRQAVAVTQNEYEAVVDLTCRYHPLAYQPLAVPITVEVAR